MRYHRCQKGVASDRSRRPEARSSVENRVGVTGELDFVEIQDFEMGQVSADALTGEAVLVGCAPRRDEL